MHYAELISLFLISISSSIIPIPTEFPVVALLKSGESFINVFIVLTAGSVIGALIGYSIGRYGLGKLGIFRSHSKENEDRVHGWFQKHGEAFLIVSPWIPLVSDLAPIVVGVEKYDSRKFLLVITIAKALKSAGMIYIISQILGVV